MKRSQQLIDCSVHSFRGRWRAPAAVRGLSRCFAGADPQRSRQREAAGAGGGVDPLSEEWEALSGEREEEMRRSTDGREPAEDERTK